MNLFEKALITYIGKENLEKIQSVKVGIAGAGGLGSNCAFNLVRSGFKNLIIVDFDVIEYTNLNRQFYFYEQVGKSKVNILKENLLKINPDISVLAINEKINEDNINVIFNKCDVIIEAFDKAIYKRMLVENYINKKDCFLVSASGLAGWGNSDELKIHKIKDNFYIVGDLVTGVSEDNPPMSPKVNIAAAKQVDLVLSYVLERM